MLNKVLILSATSGNGHIRAAQAIEKALLASGEAREVLHVDALKYASPLMRGLYAKTYLRMVNTAPTLLGWIYDETDRPWHLENRRLAFDRINTLPLARFIENYDADMIVCTHFMPASIVSWLKAKKRINTPHAVVVTDLDLHAMWMCRKYEHYFTAIEETREHLIQLGTEPARISVTGIPIDPIFAQHKDKSEMRAKLGLAQDKAVIMLSAGGFGVGRMSEILSGLGDMEHPAQVLAMCGKNARLIRDVERIARETNGRGNVEIIPVGFTDAMDEYMSAADLLVGKPGGLTTSEALAKNLVMVIVNPIPGQEERNSDHLLEEGAAIRCNNLPALAFKIDRLLEDPVRFAAMQANVQRIARPDAASHIAEQLLHRIGPTTLVSASAEDRRR
jgi:processive 1,2-diacylglycerol beta-glucosyltransferase